MGLGTFLQASSESSVTRMAKALAVVATLSASVGCVGISSGLEYPDVSNVDLDDYLTTPENDPDPHIGLSSFKIAQKTCEGIDLHVPTEPTDQEDLARFFTTQKIKATMKKARSDLYWYEFPVSTDPADGVLRLRVAVLRDRNAAAKDLHDSLLEHGPGWWGVRRGNLAVLAPKASLKEALRFAVKYRLVCWGMFTYTGADDVYTATGGYSEF